MTSKTSSSAPLGVRKVERPRPLRSVSHTGIPSSGNGSNFPNASNVNAQHRFSAQDMSTSKLKMSILKLVYR